MNSTDPYLSTPSGKPRARTLGIPFDGKPGRWNAITDVPGVRVGYTTLIEGESVRTGVTAIHPRGQRGAGDPVAAGFHSQNGNGEMTGASWIEESGTFSGPIAITNTHAVGVAHAGIVAWTVKRPSRAHQRVAAACRRGNVGWLPQRPPRHRTRHHRCAGVGVIWPDRGGLSRRRHRHELL